MDNAQDMEAMDRSIRSDPADTAWLRQQTSTKPPITTAPMEVLDCVMSSAKSAPLSISHRHQRCFEGCAHSMSSKVAATAPIVLGLAVRPTNRAPIRPGINTL